MNTFRPHGFKRSTSPADTGFTLSEAQALIGRRVRTKRARSWIAENLLLEHHHTGTVIGVSGDYTADEESRVVLAVQIRPPAIGRRKKARFHVLRLHGNVVGRIQYDGFDPLPFVLLLNKPKFETYFSLTS